MRCDYQLTGRVNGELREIRCSHSGCGHTRWSNKEPTKLARRCAASTDEPGMLQRAASYLSARDRWLSAGSPMRPTEERERLLEVCQVCPKYEDKPAMLGLSGGRCGVCKCGLVVERDILNKLAWATEDCPLGYWSPQTET